MAKRNRVHSLGVDWFLPGAKRRFATTTKASSDLIEGMAAWGLSWSEIAKDINFDDEARAVAQRFVDEGYGETLVNTMVNAQP